jgi:IclR family pca regulon transcriptional regulator
MIAKADVIEGLVKGMSVLESFDTERQRLNATLAAQRAGLTRAAARRHLLTLAHMGYLETEDGWFWLSSKVLRFSGSYLASTRLSRVVQPVLESLAAQTHESYSVVIPNGDEVVIVARSSLPALPGAISRPGFTVRAYGLHLGARLPAHATSTGRVLLAAMPSAEFSQWLQEHPLTKLTPRTVTDVRAFRSLIRQVRADDYCFSSEEHELGIQALAVPLRNPQGQTRAALNVVCETARWSAEDMQHKLLPVLRDAANELRLLL